MTVRDTTRQVLPLDRITAVLFDMDGVITDTASVHAAAWKRTFDEFLLDLSRSGGPRSGRSTSSRTTAAMWTARHGPQASATFSPPAASPCLTPRHPTGPKP